MQPLQATHLRLEPLTVAHAQAMFAVLSEPQLYRHLDYGPPPSLEHVRNVYAQLEQRASPDGTAIWLNWIVVPDGGEPIGVVQATVEPQGVAWVAYVVGSAYWGRGHAHAATSAMLEHLAQAYRVETFMATVEVENARSIALLQRLGFAQAGDEELARHALTPTERLYTRAARPPGDAPSGRAATPPTHPQRARAR